MNGAIIETESLMQKSDAVKLGACGLYDREGLQGVDIELVNAITLPSNTPSQSLLPKMDLSFIKMIKLTDDD